MLIDDQGNKEKLTEFQTNEYLNILKEDNMFNKHPIKMRISINPGFFDANWASDINNRGLLLRYFDFAL